MQKIICTEYGDPHLLTLSEGPEPTPGPSEVLVRVEAAGVSFVDSLIVRGGYQVEPPLPFTPGNCSVGLVKQVGEGVDESYVGQRVASVMAGIGGTYTTDLVVPVEALAVVPEDVSSQAAAASIESYLTILFGVTQRVTIREGENVVVLGAGGGIGLAAVDVARSQGANVLAVASSEEKRALALHHGAAHAIGYDDLKDEIRAHTGGGADVVIDPVGGPAAESALRALGTGGRFCVIGFASGEIPRLPANIVLLRNRTIVGIDWGDWSREEAGPSGNARLLDELYRRIAAGELHPPQPTVAPLADAGNILTMISERRAVGKYVLVP